MTDRLTTRQLAERLGKSPGTIGNWRVQGYGPKYIRVGRSALYRVSDVEAWERDNTFNNTAEELE